MNNDILDDVFHHKKPKPTKRRFLGLLPLIFPFLALLSNFLNGNFFDPIFIICALGFLISLILLIKKWDYGIISFFIYLLFGILFHILFIVFPIWFLFANRQYLQSPIQKFLHGSDEQQRSQFDNKVNQFKNRFKNKSFEELKSISENKLMVEEAQEAAKQLLLKMDEK